MNLYKLALQETLPRALYHRLPCMAINRRTRNFMLYSENIALYFLKASEMTIIFRPSAEYAIINGAMAKALLFSVTPLIV